MNYDHNLVSVILPAYNAERYVGEAIESVLKQSYPYFEIMIVNDASQDRTEEVVKSFDDKRINLINHSLNSGPGAARNTAINAARGRWIAILDADDQWHPDRLNKLVKIALASGDQYFIADDQLVCFDTSEGLKPWESQFTLYHKIPFQEQTLSLNLKDYYLLRCPAIKPVIPLAHIKKHDLKYHSACLMGEDFEFYCNLFRTRLKLRLYEEPLYYYRLTPGSLSTKANRLEHKKRIYERLLAEDGFTDSERKTLEFHFHKLKNEMPFETFRIAIKRKNFSKAISLAARNPRLLIEFARRFPNSWRYRKAARKLGGKVK